MKTVIVHIGNVMATQKRGEHSPQITQTNLGAISPEPRAERTLREIRAHEEWKQRIDEDWQDHIERLQQCVCELLVKNQQLRMALMAAKEPQHGYRDAISL